MAWKRAWKSQGGIEPPVVNRWYAAQGGRKTGSSAHVAATVLVDELHAVSPKIVYMINRTS
jgi:hypothetical protein